MYQSEKNFLEKIADHIPGLKGYREKDDRRETDKRLREFMGAALDRDRRNVVVLQRTVLGQGRLDLVDDLDRIANKLQQAADSIRFAAYGYAGLFDQVKVQEAELDKLYAYDGELLAEVRSFGEHADAVSSAPDLAKALTELERNSEQLLERINGRKQLFNVVS